MVPSLRKWIIFKISMGKEYGFSIRGTTKWPPPYKVKVVKLILILYCAGDHKQLQLLTLVLSIHLQPLIWSLVEDATFPSESSRLPFSPAPLATSSWGFPRCSEHPRETPRGCICTRCLNPFHAKERWLLAKFHLSFNFSNQLFKNIYLYLTVSPYFNLLCFVN